MEKKYMGRWSANNDSTHGWAEFNSLQNAIRWTRAVCRGNLFIGNYGRVSVVNRDGEVVYEGKVRA